MPIKTNFVGSSLTECMLVGDFSCIKKARERELATLFDENRRAVGMLNPMRVKKKEACTGGEEGTTPVATACPEDR